MSMTIEEMIKNSECFGIAFDSLTPECRTCDVKHRCEAKYRINNTIKPVTLVASVEDIVPSTKSTKSKDESKKSVKSLVEKTYREDMPEFRKLNLEQIEKLAVARGLDLTEFEKFKAVSIKRMRLTMALKKTYEI